MKYRVLENSINHTLMNMFAKNTAQSVEEYLANVPADRQKAMRFLHDFIQKTVPSLKAHFACNMLGYGSFPYLDSKKQPKERPVVALANQKNYISIYVCALDGNTYLAEKYAKELGNVSVGKSCIRIKKLEDLNVDTLKIAEKNPGLVSTAKT